MFVECIQCVKARLRTAGGKWHAYAPGCDLAHDEGLTVARSAGVRKQLRDYYVPISGRLLLLRAYVWAPITCQYLGAYSAPKVLMVLILRVWVARRATAQGVGI